MTIQSWLVYVVLVVVATLTPGPAVLCIVTNSSLHGWRKAVFAALGNIAGLLCLGIIAVTGLGTLLKTSELVFNIVKYAGSAYLIFLGCKLIIQKNCALSSLTGQIAMRNVSASRIFFQAFGVAMSNPKAIVFLTALFPPVYQRRLPVNTTIYPAHRHSDDLFFFLSDVVCFARPPDQGLVEPTEQGKGSESYQRFALHLFRRSAGGLI